MIAFLGLLLVACSRPADHWLPAVFTVFALAMLDRRVRAGGGHENDRAGGNEMNRFEFDLQHNKSPWPPSAVSGVVSILHFIKGLSIN